MTATIFIAILKILIIFVTYNIQYSCILYTVNIQLSHPQIWIIFLNIIHSQREGQMMAYIRCWNI
jgi:hypothetical protein